MKTFLNVLYRRILYKIPLKLLLVLLAVFAVLFACFSKADMVVEETVLSGFNLRDQHLYLGDNDLVCIKGYECSNLGMSFDGRPEGYGVSFPFTTIVDNIYGICTNGTINYGNFGTTCDVYLYEIKFDNYTSLQCQTEYNLIPINSVDQNYCTTNNLCPASGPSDCPNVGVSNLFINDLFHPGAFNIIMNIPEEIDWDYAYTNSGQNMNIDVVGYNVDYEKIDSIVQFQNYKPTSEDFQKIIGLLAPYTKIIVFFVFLFIVWAWIKKPFKSKKL